MLSAGATNLPVRATAVEPDAKLQALVDEASQLTANKRNQAVVQLEQSVLRSAAAPFADSHLGNLIADSQLAFAKARGDADMAIMNAGGIRGDLQVVPGRMTTLGELFTIQPFSNELVVMSLTGAQIYKVLAAHLSGYANGRVLQVSKGLEYSVILDATGQAKIAKVLLRQEPLQMSRDYRVVVNSFLAAGGDGYRTFAMGRDRVNLGLDLDAIVEYLRARPNAVQDAATGRIHLP